MGIESNRTSRSPPTGSMGRYLLVAPTFLSSSPALFPQVFFFPSSNTSPNLHLRIPLIRVSSLPPRHINPPAELSRCEIAYKDILRLLSSTSFDKGMLLLSRLISSILFYFLSLGSPSLAKLLSRQYWHRRETASQLSGGSWHRTSPARSFYMLRFQMQCEVETNMSQC